jgi:hypothetical protein
MKKVIVGGLAAGAVALGLATAGPANAITETFIPCPGGGAGIATNVTTCGFAQNVRYAYLTQPGPVVTAISPATGLYYNMQCSPSFTASFTNGAVVNSVRCVGGSNAVVVVW